MYSVHIVEYYSAIQKDELLTDNTNFKNTMQSKIRNIKEGVHTAWLQF